jgi:DNA-binding NarL/FixJ family response regulator
MEGVLLVDNDPDVLESLRDLITFLGGGPCIALSGMAELERVGARALACELAILDINLGPGMPTGIDICTCLRAHQFPGRIVFLTGHGQGDPLVQRACQLRHARVLRKPIGLAELSALLKGEASQPIALPG